MNGFDKPEYIFPTVIGTPKLVGKTSVDVTLKYGIDAYKNLPNMNISYPLECPVDVDWDEFTDIIVETLPLINEKEGETSVRKLLCLSY